MFSRIVSAARDLLSSSTTSEHEDNRQSSPASTDTMVATRRSGELPAIGQNQTNSTLSTPVVQNLKRKSPRFPLTKDVSEAESVEEIATPSRSKRRKVDSPRVTPINKTIISPEVTLVVEIPTIDPIPASELSNSEDIVEKAEDEEPSSSSSAIDNEVVPDSMVESADVKASSYAIDDSEFSEEASSDEGPEEETVSRSYPIPIPDDFQDEHEADEEVEVVNKTIEIGETVPESKPIEDGNLEAGGEGHMPGSVQVAESILPSNPELQDLADEVSIVEEVETSAEEVTQPSEQLQEVEGPNRKQSPVSLEISNHTPKDANQVTATLLTVSAAKYLRTELPAILPDDFLRDEDDTVVAQQPALVVAKKTKFANVPEAPKTRRIGTTAYKVEKVENPLLAPRSQTAARATKESWIQNGRSGAKTNPNRKPFSKNFFVSKK